MRPIAAVALALTIGASPLYAMQQNVQHHSLDAISLLDAPNRSPTCKRMGPTVVALYGTRRS